MTPNNHRIFYAAFNPQFTYSKDIIFLIFDANRTLVKVNQWPFTESQDMLSCKGPTRIVESDSCPLLPRTNPKHLSLVLGRTF